ncbi:MAG: Rieske (2Fe-2S) protein [bacterium]|nr:Rieske (2Fe-2S) protein [bacterium]
MSSWHYVIDENKIAENRIHLVSPKGIPILLIKQRERMYAISNICAHMGCPLHTGKLDGFILACPCHAWKFDIRTGQMVEAKEIKIPIYALKREAGKIYINLKD